MAALGSLKTLVKRFIDGRTASAVRVLNIYKVQDVHAIVVRQMSGGHHHRVLEIKPTNYEWKRWADHFHFYFLLGAIPSLMVIGAVNLFIGPAELVDTPEGYEPKHWEYFRHPITRFHSRYIQESPPKIYERHLHFLNRQQEKINLKKLRRKVEFLVGGPDGRYDSSYWYYQRAEDQLTPHVKELHERDELQDGMSYSLKW